MRNLISISDLSKDEITHLIHSASKIKKKELCVDFYNALGALLFFEPSTRTMFSFDTAIKRGGGNTLIFSDSSSTSVKKGESLRDTVENISMYADFIVMRHPLDGSVRYVSEFIKKPIINAGDGVNQHPTQALLDVFTISETQERVSNLKIGFVGDLKFGRTVHSLVELMSIFEGNEFKLISPYFLKLPDKYKESISLNGCSWNEYSCIEEIIQDVDILYVTRVQKERFADPEEYKKAQGSYILTTNHLVDVKSNLKILHPLPRVGEIAYGVDTTKYAYYFPQAENGVHMRQAIIQFLSMGV